MTAPATGITTGLVLGATPLHDLRIGGEPVIKVCYGHNTIWTNPSIIADDFFILGFLWNWVPTFVSDLGSGLGGIVSNLFSDGLGGIVNGTGGLVGNVAKFIPSIDTSSGNFGQIISQIPAELESTICDDLNQIGGLFTSNGLIGLINGLPIIGGAFQWLEGLFSSDNPLASIESLVGGVPVLKDLGQLIGVVSDQTSGILGDPINFIVDNVGNVLGLLSCGTYTPDGGTGQNVHYPIGVVGGMARMLIPDGLVSLSTQTSTLRNASLVPADNGWVETKIASQGDTGYITQIWRRYTNGSSEVTSSGVGIDLRDGVASIVRRIDGANVLVAPGLSAFTAGDTVHLQQTGNTHTLYLNGHQAGQPWVDTGNTAHSGSLYRSVAMTMQGGQDLNGPRRYSPSLAYLYAA